MKNLICPLLLIILIQNISTIPINNEEIEEITKSQDEKTLSKRQIMENIPQTPAVLTETGTVYTVSNPNRPTRPFLNFFTNNQNINPGTPNRPLYNLFHPFANHPFLSGQQQIQVQPQAIAEQSIPALQDAVEGVVDQESAAAVPISAPVAVQNTGFHLFRPFQSLQTMQAGMGLFGGGFFPNLHPGGGVMGASSMGINRFPIFGGGNVQQQTIAMPPTPTAVVLGRQTFAGPQANQYIILPYPTANSFGNY